MSELFNLLFLTTSLTLVEYVDKPLSANNLMETTWLKDVYTIVCNSVDN
jgi:hypothetical protein